MKFLTNNSQLDKMKANKYTKKTISMKMLKINEIVGKTIKNRHQYYKKTNKKESKIKS